MCQCIQCPHTDILDLNWPAEIFVDCSSWYPRSQLIKPVMALEFQNLSHVLECSGLRWTYLPGYLFLPPMFALFKQTNPAPYLAAPGRNRLVKPILGRPGPRPQERRTPGLPLPRQLVPRRPPATPARLHTAAVIPFPNSCLYFPLTLSSLSKSLLHLISYFWSTTFNISKPFLSCGKCW